MIAIDFKVQERMPEMTNIEVKEESIETTIVPLTALWLAIAIINRDRTDVITIVEGTTLLTTEEAVSKMTINRKATEITKVILLPSEVVQVAIIEVEDGAMVLEVNHLRQWAQEIQV